MKRKLYFLLAAILLCVLMIPASTAHAAGVTLTGLEIQKVYYSNSYLPNGTWDPVPVTGTGENKYVNVPSGYDYIIVEFYMKGSPTMESYTMDSRTCYAWGATTYYNALGSECRPGDTVYSTRFQCVFKANSLLSDSSLVYAWAIDSSLPGDRIEFRRYLHVSYTGDARPAAPSTPYGMYNSSDPSNYTISGLSAEMEYSQNGLQWTACTGADI